MLKVGKSLGAGGFGVWYDGCVWKPAGVKRSCRILATGPYRALVKTRFTEWQVGTGTDMRELELVATISIAAGQKWGEAELILKAADEQPLPELVTGVVKNPQTQRIVAEKLGLLGRWGRQALGDHEVPGSAALGLGVVVPAESLVAFGEDDASSYIRFRPVEGRAHYRFHASWEHEPGGGSKRRPVPADADRGRGVAASHRSCRVGRPGAMTSLAFHFELES